jgi:hypothetical protein
MLTWAICGMLLVTSTGCEKTCDEWFELEDGDCVEMREKFYGYYVGVYTGGGQTQNGFIELSKHSGGVDKLSVDGGNTFVLTGTNSFDIPLQNVYDPQATYSMEGSGSLNGNQLTFNYVASLNGQSVVMNFTGTK